MSQEGDVPVRHEHWISGRAVEPAKGKYLQTLDPSTRAAGDEVAAGSAADVHRAVESASSAQPAWARRSAAERSELLHAIADAIEANVDGLVGVEQASTGKVARQARVEIDMSAAYFRYYAGV